VRRIRYKLRRILPLLRQLSTSLSNRAIPFGAVLPIWLNWVISQFRLSSSFTQVLCGRWQGCLNQKAGLHRGSPANNNKKVTD
jgi:hypothetical protein